MDCNHCGARQVENTKTCTSCGKEIGVVEKVNSVEKTPLQYFFGVYKKYAVFQGRARRAEFWWFFLFDTILGIICMILDTLLDLHILKDRGILETLWSLVSTIPTLCVAVRRMHDCNKSGWFVLVPIYNIILCFKQGTGGPNKYGADPKEA